MDKVFSDMFSKQPDEIIDGDYYYYSPWYDKALIPFLARNKITIEDLENKQKDSWLDLGDLKKIGT